MQYKKQHENWISDLVCALKFPIITHPMGAETIPEDLKRRIPIIRMLQLLNEPDSFREYATDEEVMVYIMTASLAFPLNHEWTQVYMKLTRKYLLAWKRTKLEDLPDFLQNVINLNDYEDRLLRDMKCWIRQKQFGYLKRRN